MDDRSQTAITPGQKVRKYSGKPFKSGNKINTVKAVTTSSHAPDRAALTFVEDDSVVEAFRCKPLGD